jgi:hypothetical protein
VFETLRSKDISWKISVFEREFMSRPGKEVLKFFSNLFLSRGERTYHIMCYREKDTAYTAVLPIPKKLGLKTRVFEDGEWSYISDPDHEREVMNAFREKIDAKMDAIDKHEFFGIISVIDNKMRLRTRSLENAKSATDRRYIKKGKNLASMSKSELEHVTSIVYKDSDPPPKLKEMIEEIEEFLIFNKLFIIL